MGLRLAVVSLALLSAGLLTRGGPAEAAQGHLRRVAPRPSAPAHSAPTPAATVTEPSWPEQIQQRLATLPPAPARTAEPPALAAELGEALAKLRRALGPDVRLGVHVRALDSGDALIDQGGDLALNPASNHKLLTSIAALELLGPDYRFATTVALDGDALVLRGGGDPSLQTEDLQRLAAAVRDQLDVAGVHRIVIDDGMFSDERVGPGYDDPEGPGYSYLAPSGALSVQWNTIEVTLAAHAGAVEVFVDPPCAHVVVDNHAQLGRGEPTIVTEAAGERTRVRIDGKLRRGEVHTQRRRVADPGRFAASVFAAALAPERSLPIERGTASAAALPIAEHRSAPLLEVLHSALKFSNNFTTEQVLRTLGHHASGEPGDWRNGTAAVRAFWRALGRAPEEIVFENASGYSRRGRISARALVDLLAWSQRPGSRAAGLVGALAIAGTDGTLRDRLRDGAGRVFAKTGTLSGASALSGIVVDRSGTPRIAFSVLVNGPVTGHAAHAVQDGIVRMLIDHA